MKLQHNRYFIVALTINMVSLALIVMVLLNFHVESYGWGLSSTDDEIIDWQNVFTKNGEYARIELMVDLNSTADVYFFPYEDKEGQYWRDSIVASNVSHYVITTRLDPNVEFYDIILLENMTTSNHTGAWVTVVQGWVPAEWRGALSYSVLPLSFSAFFLGFAAMIDHLDLRRARRDGTTRSMWTRPLRRALIATFVIVALFYFLLWLSSMFYVY